LDSNASSRTDHFAATRRKRGGGHRVGHIRTLNLLHELPSKSSDWTARQGDASIADMLAVMEANQVRRLPVVEGQRLVGISEAVIAEHLPERVVGDFVKAICVPGAGGNQRSLTGGTDTGEWVLLPAAAAGLDAWGVDARDRDHYLGVIDARIRSGRTGAAWRIEAVGHLEQHGLGRIAALHEMTRRYAEHAHTGAPVHHWPAP
jgi:hypothetical protein